MFFFSKLSNHFSLINYLLIIIIVNVMTSHRRQVLFLINAQTAAVGVLN